MPVRSAIKVRIQSVAECSWGDVGTATAMTLQGGTDYPMLGIIRLALNRPYTFVVLAILILIVGPLAHLRTPVDIFPNIKLPSSASSGPTTACRPTKCPTASSRTSSGR